MIGLGIKMKRQAKSRKSAGLDIGSHSVKMVELSDRPERQALSAFGLKNIRGLQKDAVADSIKALAVELKMSVKDFSIAVSGPSVMARVISMPKMTSEELKGAVRFEAEKFISFGMDECVLDFRVLTKDAKENKNIEVLLAAVKKDHVLQKIRLVEQAGFRVDTVDVDSFAVTNAFLKNLPASDPSKTFALLNIGASFTHLSILRAGQLSFVRDIAIGSSDLSAAIAKKLSLNPAQAEELKILPKDKTQEVIDCVRPVFNNLLEETRLSFGYHENQFGRGVDEIYVSGGGAALVGLDGMFQEALGTKPRRWNPFQFLETGSVDGAAMANVKDSFDVAVGLALR